MSNYYFLVSGLPEVPVEPDRLDTAFRSFWEDVYALLTPADRKLIDLARYEYDNHRLVTLLREGGGDTPPPAVDSACSGVFSDGQLLEFVAAAKNGESVPDSCPGYMYRFLSEYAGAGEQQAEALFAEDVLSRLYYEYAVDCGNSFVSSWFRFNCDTYNVLTASVARRHSLPAQDYVVGNSEVAELLKHSGARDWGLAGTLGHFGELQKILEEENLAAREKMIDVLRVNWMEENSFFDYFSVERIFTYLIKLNIAYRWTSLDSEEGQKFFRSLIEGLRSEVKVPADFENK